MQFWWVNHKQTFRHEFRGGYIWCPQLKSNGHTNAYYEFAREVRPGDLVFSYAFGVIQGAGIAISHCYPCPRPDEFGHVGEVWDKKGWRVDVQFRAFEKKLKPKEHLEALRSFLAVRHAPLLVTGDGKQGVYLTQVSRLFAEVLAALIGPDAQAVLGLRVAEDGPVRPVCELELKGIREWEEIEVRRIEHAEIPITEREALITARVGQGRFKQNVFQYEDRCRITRVENPVHLVASHIKPWRESDNAERLEPGNGLLLTPTMDHLFDRGFISFDDSGDTLISPVADVKSLARMGIDAETPPKAGSFNGDQRHFLDHHRRFVFLKAKESSL